MGVGVGGGGEGELVLDWVCCGASPFLAKTWKVVATIQISLHHSMVL